MALRTNFDFKLLLGRTGYKRIATVAMHLGLKILGMNTLAHNTPPLSIIWIHVGILKTSLNSNNMSKGALNARLGSCGASQLMFFLSRCFTRWFAKNQRILCDMKDYSMGLSGYARVFSYCCAKVGIIFLISTISELLYTLLNSLGVCHTCLFSHGSESRLAPVFRQVS